MKILAFIAALIAPIAAHAATPVTLESQLFVEKTITDDAGKTIVVRAEPKIVVPGDKIVFELDYKNSDSKPAEGFVVANPMPEAVRFLAAETPGADYSVDGGKSFGPLASLKVADATGKLRAAEAGDVTVVRWQFAKAIPAGTGGKLIFRGIVK